MGEEMEVYSDEEPDFDENDEWAPITLARLLKKPEFDAKEDENEVKNIYDPKEALRRQRALFDELVESTNKDLYLFQFPSVLPDFAAEGELASSTITNANVRAPETRAPKIKMDMDIDDNVKMEVDEQPRLNLGPEGKIGKLLVYKSGKIALQIGSLLMDVAVGPRSSCIQEVVSVDMDHKSIYTIGTASHSLICTPDIENLIAAEHER
ncbi:RNA polymerase III RPC4-domain-containing protein [Chytridium lagenaria]|nr:RNA polymerase III RPC4-domain-containing protein [Chytridium lagenaria]